MENNLKKNTFVYIDITESLSHTTETNTFLQYKNVILYITAITLSIKKKEAFIPNSINSSALWCFWTMVLEKTLESLLDFKEIKPVNPKGNQSWIFIGKTDADTPILWLLDRKSQLIGKDTDAGQDGGQEEKGEAEDEMVGWHHQFNGHEFGQTWGDSEGQKSLSHAAVHGVTKSSTWHSDWKTTIPTSCSCPHKPVWRQSFWSSHFHLYSLYLN